MSTHHSWIITDLLDYLLVHRASSEFGSQLLFLTLTHHLNRESASTMRMYEPVSSFRIYPSWYFLQSSWESLFQLAASRSNAIIPIVSFTEVPRRDWKELPRLASRGYNRKPDFVVCTHLDRVSGENMKQQTWTVNRSFWPDARDEGERVLKCSSLMGLSASQLLEQTKATKPRFKEVWDKTSIRYQVSVCQSIEPHNSHCAFLAVRVEDPWRGKARVCLPWI